MSIIRNAVGVIPARFQTPELHVGHRYLIEEVCRDHRDVLIVIGVTPARGNDVNALTFEMRAEMIRRTYPKRTFTIVPSTTHNASYEERSWYFDAQVHGLFPDRDIMVYGSRDSFIKTYTGEFPTFEVKTVYQGSATEIRKSIPVIHTADFRSGVIWQVVNNPPIAYPTVDVAVVHPTNRELLLVAKKGEQGWRFPGSYFDVTHDVSYEDAAARTLHKELPHLEVSGPYMIGSYRIDSWLYKGSKDAVLTMLLGATYIGGEPIPGSGVDRAKWFTIDALSAADFVREHAALFTLFTKRYST